MHYRPLKAVPAAAGSWRSAVTLHWNDGFLAAILLKGLTCDYLMVQGQDCRVVEGKRSIQNFLCALWERKHCAAKRHHEEITRRTYFLWDKLDECKH
jgi:hypothetical protein